MEPTDDKSIRSSKKGNSMGGDSPVSEEQEEKSPTIDEQSILNTLSQ
jgi:hypothetical protein